jgi:hypothetical protein
MDGLCLGAARMFTGRCSGYSLLLRWGRFAHATLVGPWMPFTGAKRLLDNRALTGITRGSLP